MLSDRVRLRELLVKHEGLRLRAYKDTADRITIGYGRCLETEGISLLEARFLLANDIERVLKECVDELPWYKSLNLPRQDVIASMAYNMGTRGVKGFKDMIEAIQNGRYEQAAEAMLASRWALQVGLRANELAQMMREGRYL